MSRRLAVLAAALLAGGSFAHAKDSITIGMTLEPPGLDPTSRRGRGDRRDHAL